MRAGFRRFAVVLVTMAIIVSTGLGAHLLNPVSRSVAAAPVRYSELGVPADVAARALNQIAARRSHRATRGLTDVHFILNWLPNVEFAGLWVAQKYGWWKQAGLSMSFTPWSEAVKPELDVPARGGNTFGFQSGAAIIIAASKGKQLRALYTDTQKSVFGLTVLNSSHITNIKQLRGKRIGYQPHELYVPQTMLASVGMQINRDWIPQSVNFDISQLTEGRVDAYLTFLTNEPIALDLKGIKNHSFRAADYGFHFYDDVLFSTTGLIASNPALVRKVVGIVARGYTWAHTHPDQAARLTVNTVYRHPSELTQQIIELRKFDQFSRDSRGRFSGLMTTKYWLDSINTLYRYHEITQKVSATGIYTNQFNPNR